MHLDPLTLTCISWSIDLLIFMSNFGFLSTCDSCECEILHSKCPLHTLSEHTLTWSPRPIFQVFSYFAQCRCDIDLRCVLVKFLKYLPPVHVKCKVNTAIQYYNVMILSTDFQNLCWNFLGIEECNGKTISDTFLN